MIQSSICSISKLLDENDQLNNQNYKKYFVQSIINRTEETKYRNKLAELQEKDLAVVSPRVIKEYRNTDYFIENANFTINNFYYDDEFLKQYFNKELFKPYIFGLQWIIFPSKHVGFYLNGKVSTYSSIPDVDAALGTLTSKFMMFQGGAGLNINLPMSDILVPGIGFGANYHVFKFAKEDFDGNQKAVDEIKGLDYELRGFCSLRLYDYFALHGEVSYHFAPKLTGANRDFNTNAFAIGLGVSIFIKDK